MTSRGVRIMWTEYNAVCVASLLGVPLQPRHIEQQLRAVSDDLEILIGTGGVFFSSPV
jgi:hypothetical protein